MGTVADKLNKLIETKEAIKTSIQNKGVEVLDTDPFASYPEKIDSISGDVSEYFNVSPSETSSGNFNTSWIINNFILKLPDITLPQEKSDCTAMFREWNLPILPKITNTNFIGTAYGMFVACKTKSYDFSEWDISNITSMSNMFSSSYFEELDLRNWNLSGLSSGAAQNVFNSCWAQKILAPNLLTNNITHFNGFESCSQLETLDISNWDTSNISAFANWFYQCRKLTQLDLSHFDTRNATNFKQMFRTCPALTTLNISSFDFSKTTNPYIMFDGCSALENLQFGINLGKGYTKKSTNYEYKMDVSTCPLLTHDSIMSIINGLYDLNLTYDVANGGTLYTQQLVLGETNMAKLTDEEIAIATNKGWTLS